MQFNFGHGAVLNARRDAMERRCRIRPSKESWPVRASRRSPGRWGPTGENFPDPFDGLPSTSFQRFGPGNLRNWRESSFFMNCAN